MFREQLDGLGFKIDWQNWLVCSASIVFRGAMPSKTGKRASDNGFLARSLEAYLKLLDWTGRQLRRDSKRDRIPSDLAPILERNGLSGELWCDVVMRFGKIFTASSRLETTKSSLGPESRSLVWAGQMVPSYRYSRYLSPCRSPKRVAGASETLAREAN